MLELRPLLISRLFNAVPGVLLVGLAARLAFYMGPYAYLLAVIVASAGGVGAFRGYRMGVTVKADTVIVRGLTWSRTIPRRSLIGLTTFPALRWRSESGRTRWTPMTAFPMSGRVDGWAGSHNAACLDRLSQTLDSDLN